jgi:NADH dehydrogenase FAD-containing subunit
MATNENATLIIPKDVNGTSPRTFHVTGVAEHWHSLNRIDQQEDIFTKVNFEKALKKVSRKIKK